MTEPAPTATASPAALAERAASLVRDHVERFVERYAPDFLLPSTFAGFPVGPDVHADLAFTLGHLADNGVTTVAGATVEEATAQLLRRIDGRRTHTFFSYRVAETLHRFGTFDHNRLLETMSAGQRNNLAEACDSTTWIDLLEHGLPANYAAVLARCEIGRRSLGLESDARVLTDLVERTRRLLRANPHGFLDDSEDGSGARYDIYSADIYLFTEPFASELDGVWERNVPHVLDLVATVSSTDGSAMTWGRSLGCLALCHTVELAALALEHGLTREPGAWLHRAERAITTFETHTDGMLVDAHKHRSQDRYRGPERWLQLTFDCLGKLAWAAARLRRAAHSSNAVPPELAMVDVYPARDELVRFAADDTAAVWAFRSPATAFVVPFVGPAWADYLPTPRNPSLYEVPVDAPLPTGTPTVSAHGAQFLAAGLPTRVTHDPATIEAEWLGFPRVVPTDAGPPLDGTRIARFAVDRHVLAVTETLEFAAPPDAVSVQIAEVEGRPLRVDARASTTCRIDTVDTDGIPAYRSFWSSLPRVHQVDVAPAAHIELTWSVRPLLRVTTPDPTHHYHRSLYDPIRQDVRESSFGAHLLARPDQARALLRRTDVFHLHWPEWFTEDLAQARALVSLLADTETRLVWTQHNLRPHREVDDAEELYAIFASAADIVVHHSEWGRRKVASRYRFSPDARHVVLPHGHFGSLFDPAPDARVHAEAELGLDPESLHVFIVGAPRRDKQVQAFMDAFAATERDDVQLVVLSISDETPPRDARIVARPYEFVERSTYNQRLAAADVIALPFAPDGEMLTTGVVADVVGLGLPAIASSWPYLSESLGRAALVYRSDHELIELLGSLSETTLEPARQASLALQEPLSWDRIAGEFFEGLVDAGAFKT